jgi:poly-gamma-glutamate capsule biosynthesis protein CapA/YwtB (metallophosphatase superfamily)
MNNFNFTDCRKAVNQATFRPTAARKAEALKLLMDAVNFVNGLEEIADKPSKKATKRRRKTTKKTTPTQRVADRQEKAFHGKADTPVKPSKKARTASVEAAKESAKAVSVATGAAAKAAKRAEAKAKALKEEAEASRLSSLEEKIEMLTNLMALQMQGEQVPTIETVSFDELPFEL